MSTLSTGRTVTGADDNDGGGTDENTYSGSMATTVQNLNTPIATSLNVKFLDFSKISKWFFTQFSQELGDPGFTIGAASAANLCVRSEDDDDEDDDYAEEEEYEEECASPRVRDPDAASARSLSICSELNARIIQRGGRERASGRSNKATKVAGDVF